MSLLVSISVYFLLLRGKDIKTICCIQIFKNKYWTFIEITEVMTELQGIMLLLNGVYLLQIMF